MTFSPTCRVAAVMLLSMLLCGHCLRAVEPLKVHPQNPRIMEFRGKPQLLYTIAEHYGAVVNRDFDFIPYLNVMERDGMNLTRVFLAGFRHDNRVPANDPLAPTPTAFVQPWKRVTTSGNALDGQGKWDLSEWDDAYFSRLASFLDACGDRGIVVELTFFSTYYTQGEWQNSPFHPANNVQGIGPVSRYDAYRPGDPALMAAKEALVRKIVREVNGFDNFYFEIQNEPFWNEPGIMDDEEADFHNRMLQIIREEEATLPNRHLVAHNFPQRMNSMSQDFDILNEHYPAAVPGTTIAGAEALLQNHYQRGKILGFGENDPTTEAQVRLETWMFLVGGGAIFNGMAFANTIYTTDQEAGETPFGNAARQSIRRAAKFVNTLDLVSLRRDLSWVRSGIPAGATLQAMANPGQQHVAYFHHGRGSLVSFQLTYDPIDETDHQIAPVVSLEAGSWRATWIRPSDLSVLATEEFVHGGGDYQLTGVTYQADVALRIDRTGDGDLTPPPNPTGFSAKPQPDGSIRLAWTAADAADVLFHRIYRAEAPVEMVTAEQALQEVQHPLAVFSDLSTSVGATSYYFITAVDSNGNESLPCGPVSATALLENLPYPETAHPVPGIIQIEDFDRGGRDVAYHDLTPENEGEQYRLDEEVDIAETSAPGGGHHVFQTEAGEWLEYTIHVAQPGLYQVELSVSNPVAEGMVSLELNGANLSGLVPVPAGTGETDWQTVVIPGVVLPGGVQVIRLSIAQAAGALNQMEFTRLVRAGPTADAGADLLVIDDNFDGLATALLDASASAAGDAPITSYVWTLGGTQVATGVSPQLSLPLGTHQILLTTTDQNLLTSTDEVTIRVKPGGFANGSFEEDFSAWNVTGNVVINSALPYTPTEGGKLVAFNSDQSIPNGMISQVFATIPGQIYRLSFDMGVLAFNNSQQQLQVQVLGTSPLLSQTFVTNRLNRTPVRWENRSLQFTANSTATTLSFRDVSTTTSSIDLTLDNIRVVQQISRTLVVNSSPSPAAGISINPPDSSGAANGTTSFTRTYANEMSVTLTAPPTHAGASFSRWQKDGVDLAQSRTLNLLMDRDHTVSAIYVEALPFITSHPSNASVAAGGTATFEVVANSPNPLSYQWRFNGVPILDARSATLEIPNVQVANAGAYDVVVSSVIGSVPSSVATLAVVNTASLFNGSFEAGLEGWTSSGNLIFTSGAPYTATSGNRLIAFNGGQTAPNGVLSQSFGTIPGQTYQLAFDMGLLAYNRSQQQLQVELTGSSSLFSQTFGISRVSGANMRWEGRSIVFTANSSTTTLTFRDRSTTSNLVDLTLDNIRITPQITRMLTIQSAPSSGAAITVSPADRSGLTNGTTSIIRQYSDQASVNLTAAAAHQGLAFSKWQRNGVDFSSARSINMVMDANHTLSAVYVEGLPVITTQPVGSTVASGGTATFSVVATGSGSLAYQWRRNSVPISGATSSTFTIANVQASNTGSYDVEVSNAAGTVTSNAASLGLLSAAMLVNGSFESGLTGWTASGNLQARNASAPYTATNGIGIVLFNQANLPANGSLSQRISTVPGTTYSLAFDVGVLAYNSSTQQMRFIATGNSVVLSRNITVTGTGNGTTRWTPQVLSFVADSNSTLLDFRDVSTSTNAIDLLLDNIRLTAPAPSAAALPRSFQMLSSAVAPGITEESLGTPTISGSPGDFRIQFMAPAAGLYVLQRSEDLSRWEQLDEISTDQPEAIEFRDRALLNSKGGVFYRIATQAK